MVVHWNNLSSRFSAFLHLITGHYVPQEESPDTANDKLDFYVCNRRRGQETIKVVLPRFHANELLFQSLIISLLDYGNSLIYSSLAQLLDKLQIVQNVAARAVFEACRYDHIPLYNSLLASRAQPYRVQGRTDNVQSCPYACAELHHRSIPSLHALRNVAIITASTVTEPSSLLLVYGTIFHAICANVTLYPSLKYLCWLERGFIHEHY